MSTRSGLRAKLAKLEQRLAARYAAALGGCLTVALCPDGLFRDLDSADDAPGMTEADVDEWIAKHPMGKVLLVVPFDEPNPIAGLLGGGKQ